MNSKDVSRLAELLGIPLKDARRQLYFLRQRYGHRYGVNGLLRYAVAETVASQALIELEQAESELENGE